MPRWRKNHERLPPDAAGHERVICRLGPQRSQRDRCPSLSEIVLNDLNIAIEHGDLEQRISRRSQQDAGRFDRQLAIAA